MRFSVIILTVSTKGASYPVSYIGYSIKDIKIVF